MKARIASELLRSDLTTQIAAAIVDAIDVAAATRFWFNEVRGLSFATVAGQEAYGAAALADIPNLTAIDAMWLTVNGQRRTLCPVSALELDEYLEGTPGNGEPTNYATQAGVIRLFRIPDIAYSVRIDGVSRLSALSADADTNAWMTEGERLIRTQAKALLLEEVVIDPANADRMFARYEMIKRDLTSESDGRASGNDIQGWS